MNEDHKVGLPKSGRSGLGLPRRPASVEKPGNDTPHDSPVAASTPASPETRPPFERKTVLQHLRSAVIGQDDAAAALVNRLSLTMSELDLRPERPNGVFLFAGPTGVGKTEMAMSLAEALHGARDAVIRLDMSEYQDGAMAVAKLVGAGPGYVGHDHPESWLTTRVLQNPHSLVLLDEVEKAHPAVWTTFLQVFDAGRLTDGRGQVADFRNTVIIMTSNLGTSAASRHPLGFAGGDDRNARVVDVIAAVRDAMPIELFNRIDETVVFRSLTPDDILNIAQATIRDATDRLRDRGYDLTTQPSAVQYIANVGYDAQLGARHLHRNIERLLLQPAAERGPGRYRVAEEAGALTWNTI